jgi:threonine dehydrogenase-like Zn-dependent dehydrogenase
LRAVEIAEDRRLVSVERPAARPGVGEALIEVAYCGICGSDLHFRDVPALFPAGTVPGHEFSGRVIELGDGLPAWRLGERVAVLPFAQCGECDLCRAGQEQVCPHAIPNGVGLGTGRAGGFAEQVVVDGRMLFTLPDSVDDRAGALTEPLAVAVRAVAQSRLGREQAAIVLGGGTIGLLTALVLADRGYDQVVVVSRNTARRELAAALGLRAVSLDDAHAAARVAPSCVFECAGTPAAARLAVELAGILTYARADFAAAIEMLARGAIPVDQIVTATAPLENAEASFQALTVPGNGQLKILLSPREQSKGVRIL